MRALLLLLAFAGACRAAEPDDRPNAGAAEPPRESPRETGASEEPDVAEAGAAASIGGVPPPGSAGGAARRQRFVSLEYDPFRDDGTGSITGQAFLRTRGGDVKFGAGCIVHLLPVTSYSQEWFEREIVGGETLEPADARADHYHWTTRADGFGSFTFEHLPRGDYYLACRIVWDIRDTSGGFTPAGGWAFATVGVGDGETRAVVTR